MQSLRNYSAMMIVGVFFLGIFSSCLDDANVDRRAYGDALIRTYLQGDSIVYNVQLYTYSSHPMKEVSVNTKSNPQQVIELDSLQNRFTFASIPNRATYTTNIPEADHYYFDVVYGVDDALRVADYLDTTVIFPPMISELRWDSELEYIILKWRKVFNAQYYKVLLLDDKDNLLFESQLLENTQMHYDIGKFTYGWYSGKQPTDATQLKVVVNAYLFEPVLSTFDIQSISTNDKHLVDWWLFE